MNTATVPKIGVPSLPASDADAVKTQRQARRRLRVLVSLAVLLALVWAGLFCRTAWKSTQAREAYLPELEARAVREPANRDLLLLLAVRRCEARQYATASVCFERAANLGAHGVLFWRTWAATLAATGDIARARAALQMGMARDHEAAPALQTALERANTALTRPAVSLAALGAQVAEAIFPDGIHQASREVTQGSVLNALASWQGRRDPAHSGFATRQDWAAAEPANPTAQRYWGEALLTNARANEAEAVFRHALTLRPNDALLYASLGESLRQQKRDGDAGKAFQQSLRLQKDNLPALLGLGQAMLDKNIIRIAGSCFERATQRYPGSAEAWIGMGKAAYLRRVDMASALAAFQRARQLAPERSDYFPTYANALRAAGQTSEAETLLNARRHIAPDDAEAHFLLALLQLDFRPTPERRASAEKELRDVLRLEPQSAPAQGRLGQLLVESGRGAEAIPMLEAALRVNNRSVPQLRALATAFQQTGQPDRAREVTESLQTLARYLAQVQTLEDQRLTHPADVEVHRKLALLYEQGGELEKARFHRQVIQMLKTHPKAAPQILQHLNEAMSRLSL